MKTLFINSDTEELIIQKSKFIDNLHIGDTVTILSKENSIIGIFTITDTYIQGLNYICKVKRKAESIN